MWLGCREASESSSQHSPQGEISLREYDATACIIFTELVEMWLGELLLGESTVSTPPEDRQACLSGAGRGYFRRTAK